MIRELWDAFVSIGMALNWREPQPPTPDYAAEAKAQQNQPVLTEAERRERETMWAQRVVDEGQVELPKDLPAIRGWFFSSRGIQLYSPHFRSEFKKRLAIKQEIESEERALQRAAARATKAQQS
jgi:hypothetical protein